MTPRAADQTGVSALRVLCAGILFAAFLFWPENAPAAAPLPLTAQSLKQRAGARPWLSRPESRLVVNPFNPGLAPVPEALGPSLPLDCAYYAGELPTRLSALWTWTWQPTSLVRGGGNSGSAKPYREVRLPFLNAPAWRSEGAAATQGENGEKDRLRLALTATGYGSATFSLAADLSQTPFLRINVPHSNGLWALKIGEDRAGAGAAAPEFYLERDTRQTGSFFYDLRTLAAGWTGEKRLRLRLFSVGAAKSAVTISDLRLFGGGAKGLPFAPRETLWYPHQIVSAARATMGAEDQPAAAVRVESAIMLPDQDTIAQRLRVQSGANGSLVLTGQIEDGQAQWDAARQCVVVRTPRLMAVIRVSRSVRWQGAFGSWTNWLNNRRGASGSGKVWSLRLDGVKTGDAIVVAARFTRAGAGQIVMPGRLGPAAFGAALVRCEADWDRHLARVPRPRTVPALRRVAARGVTPNQMEQAYGRAWVFLLAGILPLMPENGFSYPQAACGKPSLWGEGAKQARASAQWESFIAVQLLALADPQTAWKAYEGLLSLVPPDGVMAGEGLPSCHTQTAWILFSLTGNETRLRAAYPAIKRLLEWKVADPRWIHSGETKPGTKDAEFVVHALRDLGYAERIARQLRLPAEQALWHQKTTQWTVTTLPGFGPRPAAGRT